MSGRVVTHKPIIQPILNRTRNHCWLSSILQLFTNNMDTLFIISNQLNAFLQNPANFDLTSTTGRQDYEKLLFLNNFIVTSVTNISRATTIYSIELSDLTRIHRDLFDTTTYGSQDVQEVIAFWFSKMDDVKNIVIPSIRPTINNIVNLSMRRFLFQLIDINYDDKRVERGRSTEQRTVLEINVNRTNKCNSVQELINELPIITRIDETGSKNYYNSKEIIILPETEFLFIQINRNFITYTVNTPLFIDTIIDLPAVDKTLINFVLQGVICHPPGHYYYISCSSNGSLYYKYDDDRVNEITASNVDEMRDCASYLFYSRNNISTFPLAPRLKDADISKLKELDKESLAFCRRGRVKGSPKEPIPYPIYKPVIKGAHPISKSVMLFTYSSMDSIPDDTLTPSLFYFYLGSSVNINYFDYLFYLDVQSDFCKILVNNVPNSDYFDLFNMGESLKDKYNKSIEYTTEQFDKVYKQNEEKTINKDVNLDYTVYNKREILTAQTSQTDKSANKQEKRYDIFSYSSKLDE